MVEAPETKPRPQPPQSPETVTETLKAQNSGDESRSRTHFGSKTGSGSHRNPILDWTRTIQLFSAAVLRRTWAGWEGFYSTSIYRRHVAVSFVWVGANSHDARVTRFLDKESPKVCVWVKCATVTTETEQRADVLNAAARLYVNMTLCCFYAIKKVLRKLLPVSHVSRVPQCQVPDTTRGR